MLRYLLYPQPFWRVVKANIVYILFLFCFLNLCIFLIIVDKSNYNVSDFCVFFLKTTGYEQQQHHIGCVGGGLAGVGAASL